ncbi:MAG: MBL fold metallo-hydrolase [Syntrophales bacterium]|jgi:glyoxylase-like metal-dependent hydrolase (beta-lactamase superfamily II)|nr:MBL fold metallo-hydrolase [Syntrophales bacterium]
MPNQKNPETSIGKITGNLYLITLPMPFRLRPVNVVVLVHEGGVALFDTGLNLGHTFARLEDSLKMVGRSACNIDHIFITHHHADHCGLAGRIKEISGAVIHMSEVVRQVMHNNHDHGQVADTTKKFYVEQGIAEDKVEAYLVFLRYFRKATAPFQIDECLDFNREYRIGDTAVEVFPTPGHARDHVCYFFRREGMLFSGDHILPESALNLHPDLFCPGFRPAQAMLDSLARIEVLPATMILPAHGEPFSNLKGIVAEVRKHHGEKKNLILESIKEGPKTASQVSRDIFGTELPGFDVFLTLNETYAHLVELRHEGIVRELVQSRRIVYRIE